METPDPWGNFQEPLWVQTSFPSVKGKAQPILPIAVVDSENRSAIDPLEALLDSYLATAHDDCSTHYHLPDDVYIDNPVQDAGTDDSQGFYQNGLWVPAVEQSPRPHDHSQAPERRSLLEVVNDDNSFKDDYTDFEKGSYHNELWTPSTEQSLQSPQPHDYSPVQRANRSLLTIVGDEIRPVGEFPDDVNGYSSFKNDYSDFEKGSYHNGLWLPSADDVHDDNSAQDASHDDAYGSCPHNELWTPSTEQSLHSPRPHDHSPVQRTNRCLLTIVGDEIRPVGEFPDDVNGDSSFKDAGTDDSQGFYQNGLWVPAVEQSPRPHDHSQAPERRSLLEVVNDETRPIGEFPDDVNGDNSFKADYTDCEKGSYHNGLWLPSADDVHDDNSAQFSDVCTSQDASADDAYVICPHNGLWTPSAEQSLQSPRLHDHSPVQRANRSLLTIVGNEIRPVGEAAAKSQQDSGETSLQQRQDTTGEAAQHVWESMQQEEAPVSLAPSTLHRLRGFSLDQPHPSPPVRISQPVILQLQLPTQTTAEPTKDLLQLLRHKPPKMRQQMMDEERKRENERKYERYSRHLATERRARDGLIETDLRLHDASMPSRELFTAAAMRQAIAASPKTRALSHDGRWQEQYPPENAEWFNLVEDREERMEDRLHSIGHCSNSVRSDHSQQPKEEENELDVPVDSKNLIWQRGFVVNQMVGRENMYEICTLQGRQHIKTNNQTADLFQKRVRFAMLSNGEAIVRRSSYQISGIFSLNLRMFKTMKLVTTAIIGYRHPSSTADHLIWSDDAGLISVLKTTMERYERSIHPEQMSLRVAEITITADHSSMEQRISARSWRIQNIFRLAEETQKENELEVLPDSAWPRLAQRVDDLQWIDQGRDGVIRLHSPAFPERLIHCKKDQWIRSEEEERSRAYRTLRFTAVIVPHEPHQSNMQRHWQCLMLAPICEMSRTTEDRIFNLRPLDVLMGAREASLPVGWTEGDSSQFEIVLYDTETR